MSRFVLLFAPVPGLAAVASILLEIWDAVQLVESPKFKHETSSSFSQVLLFIKSQTYQTFLNRYFHRTAILEQITACNSQILAVENSFRGSVEIRTLQAVHDQARQLAKYEKLTERLLEERTDSSLVPSPSLATSSPVIPRTSASRK
ncbi:hypothetical protein H0H81_012079 [Sphagnurus paluster]|uniref:Uncharacterized protein n=1 Tax=Sphagnurus paluster TaxID=117069 RepID=A0A9P7K3R4_9AGAR|nr:hypothetical protein H0H81_012079 [Sphagnurus paluster]